MSCQSFQLRIKEKFKGMSKIKFGRMDNGSYVAYLDDDIKIVGNATSKMVCVNWGSGHMAMAVI